MKQNDYWHEDELYDMDNVYNMERDENYAAADTSVWYTWHSKRNIVMKQWSAGLFLCRGRRLLWFHERDKDS